MNSCPKQGQVLLHATTFWLVCCVQDYPKLSQSYYALLECLAQDHMTFISNIEPQVLLYILSTISEGLTALGKSPPLHRAHDTTQAGRVDCSAGRGSSSGAMEGMNNTRVSCDTCEILPCDGFGHRV